MSAIEQIMKGHIAVLFADHQGPKLRARFRHLSKIIHPDVNDDPRAAEAFARMSKYVSEVEKNPAFVESDVKTGSIVISRGGQKFAATFKHRYDGDLGEEFVTYSTLTTRFANPKDGEAAAERVKALSGFLTGALSPYSMVIPSKVDVYDAGDVSFYRRHVTASLRAVVDAWGPWNPKHAAWLASCLLDFSCLMDNQKIVHCALTPENVFVDLENHAIQVIGGWAFVSNRGSKMTRMPSFVHRNCSSKLLEDKKAKGAIDVAASKALVEYALGSNFNTVPTAFKAWVSTGVDPDSSPIDEYKKWESVRGAAFGPRKFVKHDKIAADAYKEMKHG